VVSNSSSRSKGHHGKSFRCKTCWAYREKFGPECQLNFLLSTARCRNSVTEGRRERYCFLYSFMTPGILYQRNRTALGRFVVLRSVWEVLEAAAVLPAWSDVGSEQGGKPSWKVESKHRNENQATKKRLVSSCRCWSMYRLPLG